MGKFKELEIEKQEITKAVFRVFPENDIIAIFPEETADQKGNLMSYQTIGQHGACSPDLIKELPAADPTGSNYKKLVRELESIGYILEIIN